jgi:hypothetical protein
VTPQEILAGLDDDSLKPASFHHEDHVAASWLALQQPGATHRICGGILRLATRAGVAQKFDEALTKRWLRLIDERRQQLPKASWLEFRAAFPELFDKELAQRALEQLG